MSSKRLFVVVSTGAPIANLPPLLEHARRDDLVVWVESAGARDQRWSAGPRVVLNSEEFGLQEWPAIKVEELDDAAEVARASLATVERAKNEGLSVYLVVNGGTKMTTHGLLRAWGEMSPELVWGEQPVAAYRTYTAALAGPTIRRYCRHELDLPHVLTASGHTGTGVKFWPGPLADDLTQERYGIDVAHTRALHLAHHLRKAPGEGEPLPSYRETAQVAPEDVQNWRQELLAALCKRGLAPSALDDGVLQHIYTRTIGVARAGAKARAKQPPIEPIGSAFEKAVARRVHSWLGTGQHSAVQSAWRDVKVYRGEPDPVAQLDVVLVLKNGVLLHLECKSFTVDLKDLNARLYVLQQAGSLGARMVMCAPVLTGFANEEWFAGQHKRKLWFEAKRHLGFVPFTLPGQPVEYEVEQGGVSQGAACLAMEFALGAALKAYMPR